MTDRTPTRRARVLKALAVLCVVIVVSPIVIVRLFTSMSQDRR
jgi:hypothetical protein